MNDRILFEDIKPVLRRQARRLFDEAQTLVDRHKVLLLNTRYFKPRHQRGSWYLRTQRREYGVYISWYRLYGSGIRGVRCARREYINLADSPMEFQFALRQFRDALPWELDLIGELEPRFAVFRRRTHVLWRISKMASGFDRIAIPGQLPDVVPD